MSATIVCNSVNGGPQTRSRIRRTATRLCSVDSWKRRVPITIWLPNYSWEYLLRDMIAGITVGLTSIPQGIAYAIVAGVPPQVGLYSSIFPGLVYMIFGSCKDVTVGPTAILAALLAKYVAKSVDFAYLAAFLSGCLILLLGVLQLGFLLDFISKPVISGFTTAAALQIGAAQLKTLFRIKGSSGDTFISALINFFKHITTVQLWDTLLGILSIVVLLLLKISKISVSDSSPRWRVVTSQVWVYLVRARNAIVVFIAAIIAYILKAKGFTPFALTGTIDGGLPHFGPPPFSTTVKNKTIDFEEMLSVFGVEGLVMPLVAILESIAIAKAFAGSRTVDNTQEMIAIGACNMMASFAQSMPATGSFTRTALNHASGVLTPAGSFFKAMLVLLAVTQLSSAFYFIPRAALAAIIMVAMMSIIELNIVKTLWKNSKLELAVYTVSLVVGALAGLEYGILAGAAADAARALHAAARPALHVTQFKVGNQDCIALMPLGVLSYACAEYITHSIRKHALIPTQLVVIDGRHLHSIDLGVAENLLTVILDLERKQHKFLLWNFSEKHQKLFKELNPQFGSRLVNGPSIDQHVLGLDLIRRGNGLLVNAID
ncbi:sodium-independent sulfate anion transporter-like isoform X3 [Plodia interpunctella]|uniref:sodium-independent sulfate anion transporter-like isoform X3 n=1 Tax=Plodia interpunctella TaxID=58824 RepID=UPI002367A723|nr:sodium-independent sulfate anion transporter-like isoform X3 [Plodia interpunctella]